MPGYSCSVWEKYKSVGLCRGKHQIGILQALWCLYCCVYVHTSSLREDHSARGISSKVHVLYSVIGRRCQCLLWDVSSWQYKATFTSCCISYTLPDSHSYFPKHSKMYMLLIHFKSMKYEEKQWHVVCLSITHTSSRTLMCMYSRHLWVHLLCPP